MFLNFRKNNIAIVPLYHAIFETPPKNMTNYLHNVNPNFFRQHVRYLQSNFDMVPIDYIGASNRSKPTASITFDDGYKCVNHSALPTLLDMDVPCSIFINSSTIEGKRFWRDKIRWIINNDLIEEWKIYFQCPITFDKDSLYRSTKKPNNNSLFVEKKIDDFLRYHNCRLPENAYCFDSIGDFISHPLIVYGNHTHDHYVLSSLTDEQQFYQIKKTKDFLDSLQGINISNILSIPFGNSSSINDRTLQFASELGYEGVLMSRERINLDIRSKRNIRIIERFMPGANSLEESLAQLPEWAYDFPQD